MEKTCGECIWNDDALCDRLAYMVKDDDKACKLFSKSMDQQAKADSGKAKLSLVPSAIIYAIARIREYGCKKYKDPDNWKRVEPQRYWEATLRHIVAAWDDYKTRDEESGLMHIEHACCNLAFLLQLMEEEK